MADVGAMINQCSICGATETTGEFYAGVRTRCKPCHRAKVKENRIAKADYYKAYDAERFQNDPRVKHRHARYKATPEGKAAAARSRVKWLAENSDKRAAHVILGNAVRDGRIKKPKQCSECGTVGRIEGHHDDYSLPLAVSWLCRKCHFARHKS